MSLCGGIRGAKFALHENEAKKLKLYNSVFFFARNAETSIEKKSKATMEVYLYFHCRVYSLFMKPF